MGILHGGVVSEQYAEESRQSTLGSRPWAVENKQWAFGSGE